MFPLQNNWLLKCQWKAKLFSPYKVLLAILLSDFINLGVFRAVSSELSISSIFS